MFFLVILILSSEEIEMPTAVRAAIERVDSRSEQIQAAIARETEKIQKAFSAELDQEIEKAVKTLEKQKETATKAGKLELALKIKLAIADLESKRAPTEKSMVAVKNRGRKSKSVAPPQSVEFENHRYLFVADKTTWFEARDRCLAEGGHLVSITSEREMEFVNRLVGSEGAWTGASDAKREGEWHWITGEPFQYTHWYQGEPNNIGNQHSLFIKENGQWDDVNSDYRAGFVCEWD